MEADSPKLLFELVDLKPIHGILWVDLHFDGPGRLLCMILSGFEGFVAERAGVAAVFLL